ncbi:OLC1v1030290C1 [Oldenlandia corymbosa var. corymbosa]|uniref:OLC1v1030290C1 n=1 Tax=Oldenlandia corymbosa var. corymbosa TaxID=529605 RepID=A0AAV1CJ62_OLDCO|nr:OLC1v1030290C1 [Oldenlandia corymbosa var. corymbosa]
MASNHSSNRKKKLGSSQPVRAREFPKILADDDDFQDPCPSFITHSKTSLTQNPLKPSNSFTNRPPKKLKPSQGIANPGKENNLIAPDDNGLRGKEFDMDWLDIGLDSTGLDSIGLDSIESTLDCEVSGSFRDIEPKTEVGLEEEGKPESYSTFENLGLEKCEVEACDDEFEGGTQLDILLKLCEADEEVEGCDKVSNFSDNEEFCREWEEEEEEEQEEELGDESICCPLCGNDITGLTDELRQVHTNECLDKDGTANEMIPPHESEVYRSPGQVLDNPPHLSPSKVVDVSPVLEWLRNLGLAKYEEIFVREEIDWDTLKWLTEEDLCGMGVAALGPRKKLIHAINDLRKEGCNMEETHIDDTKVVPNEINKCGTNKLITDFFPGSASGRRRESSIFKAPKEVPQSHTNIAPGIRRKKKHIKDLKNKNTPIWCDIPGTPFRVDAFKYLRRDCSHWFLTHFHMDHYQGLTRSFSHGRIYCSSITAKLVNMKLGIAWDKLQILPLNQKVNIAGIDVTCFDANHCPGAIIILFEPPNGKAVLHTGDFRFCEEMTKIPTLQTSRIHRLILDTTYCDPQYDFPKQEAVIQFVIEAIQAEDFNPKTLFLIGSYTIGKERLFLELARVLRKKVYVNAAKLRILECLGFPKEDTEWFTLNEYESHIHVVPMWAIASFKRLKHLANQYSGRFNLIVAFSPTGWSFSKGKKKSPGRRWQQGTIIRYEVPYSEHSSFSELRDFVKFISPATIIPSVNNHGAESTNTMLAHLLS